MILSALVAFEALATLRVETQGDYIRCVEFRANGNAYVALIDPFVGVSGFTQSLVDREGSSLEVEIGPVTIPAEISRPVGDSALPMRNSDEPIYGVLGKPALEPFVFVYDSVAEKVGLYQDLRTDAIDNWLLAPYGEKSGRKVNSVKFKEDAAGAWTGENLKVGGKTLSFRPVMWNPSDANEVPVTEKNVFRRTTATNVVTGQSSSTVRQMCVGSEFYGVTVPFMGVDNDSSKSATDTAYFDLTDIGARRLVFNGVTGELRFVAPTRIEQVLNFLSEECFRIKVTISKDGNDMVLGRLPFIKGDHDHLEGSKLRRIGGLDSALVLSKLKDPATEEAQIRELLTMGKEGFAIRIETSDGETINLNIVKWD